MAELKNIGKGIAIFFAGYMLSYALDLATPIIETAGNAIFSSTALTEVAYFTQIIITILTMLIAPSFYIIKGLQTQMEEEDETKNLLIATIIFFFGIIITIKGWFMVEALGNLTSTTLLQACFWAGILILFTEIIIITPIALITKKIR